MRRRCGGDDDGGGRRAHAPIAARGGMKSLRTCQRAAGAFNRSRAQNVKSAHFCESRKYGNFEICDCQLKTIVELTQRDFFLSSLKRIFFQAAETKKALARRATCCV